MPPLPAKNSADKNNWRSFARDLPCDLEAPSPGWRSLSGVVHIHPKTKKLITKCHIIDCVGTVDFAGVRVETH